MNTGRQLVGGERSEFVHGKVLAWLPSATVNTEHRVRRRKDAVSLMIHDMEVDALSCC